jgi:hypothetical protein
MGTGTASARGSDEVEIAATSDSPWRRDRVHGGGRIEYTMFAPASSTGSNSVRMAVMEYVLQHGICTRFVFVDCAEPVLLEQRGQS